MSLQQFHLAKLAAEVSGLTCDEKTIPHCGGDDADGVATPEARFPHLVPADDHGDECARSSADQDPKVERRFRDPPLVVFGLDLVAARGDHRDDVDGANVGVDRAP